MSRVLITGGGGFLGQKLARHLAETGKVRGQPISKLVLVDTNMPDVVEADFTVRTETVDISDSENMVRLFGTPFDVIWHLAAVVSGQAEAEFDLGMRVNLAGSNLLFDAARAQGNCPVVVYASSCAVYGGDFPNPVPEMTELNPQTSYGTAKAMGELLLQDMSRKGFIDGRGLRLPTVTIRPGKANAAASSFMSSIFRDPLQGETANCPVEDDFPIWHSAPRTVVANLAHAAEIDGEAMGMNRNIPLPGRTDTIGDMIAAMTDVAGPAPAALITRAPEPSVEAIARSWPSAIVHDKALSLGFRRDESFADSVRWFLEDDIKPVSG